MDAAAHTRRRQQQRAAHERASGTSGGRHKHKVLTFCVLHLCFILNPLISGYVVTANAVVSLPNFPAQFELQNCTKHSEQVGH